MRLFVADRTGTGVRGDPFRPNVDLAALGRVGCQELPGNRFLCVAPLTDVAPAGTVDLGVDFSSPMTTQMRTRLATALAVDPATLAGLSIGEGVFQWMAGRGASPRWKDRWLIRIAGVDLYDAPVVSGGATASDSFTYSNGTLATVSGGVWVSQSGTGIGGNYTVASNLIQQSLAGAFVVVRYATAFTTDHFTQLGSVVMNGTGEQGLYTRMPSTGNTGYYAYIDSGGGSQLNYVLNNTFTLLDSASGVTVGGTYRLESNGSLHTLTRNGVEVCSATDTNLPSNTFVGLAGFASGAVDSMDNWSGGDLTTADGAKFNPRQYLPPHFYADPRFAFFLREPPQAVADAASEDHPTTAFLGVGAWPVATVTHDATVTARADAAAWPSASVTTDRTATARVHAAGWPAAQISTERALTASVWASGWPVATLTHETSVSALVAAGAWPVASVSHAANVTVLVEAATWPMAVISSTADITTAGVVFVGGGIGATVSRDATITARVDARSTPMAGTVSTSRTVTAQVEAATWPMAIASGAVDVSVSVAGYAGGAAAALLSTSRSPTVLVNAATWQAATVTSSRAITALVPAGPWPAATVTTGRNTVALTVFGVSVSGLLAPQFTIIWRLPDIIGQDPYYIEGGDPRYLFGQDSSGAYIVGRDAPRIIGQDPPTV